MIAVGALAAHIAHAIDVERIDLDVPLALQGLDSVSAQDVPPAGMGWYSSDEHDVCEAGKVY